MMFIFGLGLDVPYLGLSQMDCLNNSEYVGTLDNDTYSPSYYFSFEERDEIDHEVLPSFVSLLNL
jgi:hypothetical protein